MAYQTSTNQYQTTKYIVSSAGDTPYVTIQSAINAANAVGVPTTIFVRPGTYTENLTLYTGLAIVAYDKYSTVISGTHTPPNAGRVIFENIAFLSGTDIFNSAAAGATDIRCLRCLFSIANGYIYNLVNWTGKLFLGLCLEDVSTTNGVINNTGGAEIKISFCTVGAGTAKSLTINGAIYLNNSTISCPVSISGAAATYIYAGCSFEGTVSVSGSVALNILGGSINTGVNTALNLTTSTSVILSNVSINTSNAIAIAGTSTVQFDTVTFINSKGLAGTIVETLAGITKTGEIYANTILRMEMTGFYSWAAAGPYFDDTTLGTFKLLVGGTGYIKGKVVTWVAQNIAGMTSGSTWYIYIDSTGTIGKANAHTDALYEDNIVLFECLYDETTGTKVQYTVCENHPYKFQTGPSNYLHDIVGPVIENVNLGANITLSGTVKIAISGADVLADHGLSTTISDTGGVGVTWNKMYTNAGGKWARDGAASDTFNGRYNAAGTPTALGGSKFGVYTLYVSKQSLNTATPTYFAVLDTSQYNTSGAATTAIANGTTAKATNELALLEMAQLGYIIFSQASGTITTVIISKSTLKSTLSTAGASTASLINTNVTNFNGILSATDTNVQSALETIDNLGMGSTSGYVYTSTGATTPTWQALPAAGITSVAGTANQITASTLAGAVTLSTPATFIAPGTIAATTTVTAGTNLVSTAGLLSLPATSSTVGQITIGGNVLFHTYGGEAGNDAWRNLFVGKDAGNFTCSTAVNYGANIGIGCLALRSLTGGQENFALGYKALNALQGNANNGYRNVAIGNYAGYRIVANGGTGDEGSYNTLIGYGAGSALTGNEYSNIFLGSYAGVAGQHNRLQIGNSSGTGANQLSTAFIHGIYGVTPGGTLNAALVDSNGQLGSVASLGVANGGTGAATLTDHGILLGSGTGAITPLGAASNGQLPIGSAGADPVLATISSGSGIVVTNGAGTISIATSAGGMAVSESTTSNAVQMAVNTTYVATSTNGGTLVVYTLPATAAVGDQVKVIGKSTAFWKVAQNATDTIFYGAATSTPGNTGYATTAQIYASATFTCITASSIWAITEFAGTITLA